MVFLFGMQPATTVAQVVADKNAPNQNRPSIETTANGTTMVQIAAPSAGGVSRNLYQQLDIDKSGLIFNNSHFISNTQLAGYVHGNPNLVSGNARIILNEVNGSNPSCLRGFAEIAGQKADLIIANPNGIIGDGFGLINTGHAVLTTGIPVFGGSGSLDAFRVTGGQISIQGEGMNASEIDRVDLITRAVSVNSGIYGNNLNIITGANQVDYNTLNTQSVIAEGNKSQVQIDVGQLGGMYAQKIYMVGTEKGVGVNSQGIISSSGDLSINSEGQVVLKNATSAGKNVSIAANDDIINQASLYAHENTTIQTKGDINNSGILASGQNIRLETNNLLSIGSLGSGVNTDGTTGQTGNLFISTTGTITTHGQNAAGGNITMEAESIDISGSKTYSGGNAIFTSYQGDIDNTAGLIRVDNSLKASAQGTIRNIQGTNNAQAQISAGQINLTATNILNQKSRITQTGYGETTVIANGTIDNSNGQINTNGTALSIQANSFDNSQGQVQHAGEGLLSVKMLSDLKNYKGKMATNGQLDLGVIAINNNQGMLSSSGQSMITVQNNIDNAQGTIIGENSLNISTKGSISNEQGIIQANKGISIDTQSINNQNGQLFNLNNSSLNIAVANDINNKSGVIGSKGEANLIAQSLDNQNGKVLADDNITARVLNGINNIDGQFKTVKNLTLDQSTANLSNTGGQLKAGNGLNLKANLINNEGGMIASVQDMNLSISGLAGAGQTIAGQSLNISSSEFTNNEASQIKADRNIDINVSGTFKNNGTITAVSNLNIHTNNLENNTNAALIGGTKLNVLAGDKVDNHGRFEADLVKVSGKEIRNSGEYIGDNVTLVADHITNKDTGVIAATSNINLFAKTAFDNKDGASLYSLKNLTIAGSENKDDSNQFIDRTGVLLNQSATIEAGNDIQIYANQITNKKREFVTGQTVISQASYGLPGKLIGKSYDNSTEYASYLTSENITETNIIKDSPEGKILAGHNLILNSGTVDNNLSWILAANSLNISSNSSVNNTTITRTRNVNKNFKEYSHEQRQELVFLGYEWESSFDGSQQIMVPKYEWQLVDYYGSRNLPSSTTTETIGYYTSRYGGGQSVSIDAKNINNTVVNPGNVSVNSGSITSSLKANLVSKQTLDVGEKTVLPTSGLYTIHKDPTYSYLVETNSRFTNFGRFLSSDYLYSNLLDTNKNIGKRIGDGFYEQKLVTEQINQLTGRELLQGYSSQKEEYKSLMNNAANYAKEFNLEIGVALTAEQMNYLSSDIVWLVEKEIQGQKVLVPVVYLAHTRADDLHENGALIVADNIQLSATGDIINNGVIKSTNGTQLTANNITVRNGIIEGGQVGLVADNIAINGGRVSATGDISVNAEENLEIGSSENKQGIAIPFTLTEKTTNLVSSIQAGSNINLIAGQNANLEGSQVSANKDINIEAGDVTITAVKDRLMVDKKSGVKNGSYSRTKTDDETAIGSNLEAVGQINIKSGQNSGNGDVTIEGSTINSKMAEVTVKASNDITIKDATERHEAIVQTHREKSGFLSKKTIDTYDYTIINQSKGSTLSGENVNVISGNNALIQGSDIVGVGDVNLIGERNVSIASGQDTIQEEHLRKEKKSGLFGSGGLGITIGSKSEKLDVKEKTLAQNGSVVGSVNGNVNVQSGNQINSIGTAFEAGSDINITGKAVNINNSTDSYHNTTKYELKQSGISVSLGGTPVTTALDAANSIQRSGEVSDKRLQALYGYKANEDIKELKNMKNVKDNISVNISIGSSKTTSEQNVHIETVNESNMIARNSVNITATGDDVNLTSTKINATDIDIQAKRDINLNAAQNKQQSDSKTDSSSWSLGAQINGGFVADASIATGRENSTIIANSETVIKADDTVNLTTKQDANINGAKIEGKRVVANIDGNLNIKSLKDIDNYRSKNNSGSIGVGAGVTGSLNQGKMDSTYNSVVDQAGIYAGQDGFDIKVGGNTNLKGAVISSEATPDKNKLSTDTLTYSDIQNKAEYSASSVGVNLNTKSNAKLNEKGLTPNIGVTASGNADSTTKSAISPGTIEIRSNPNQDISGLSRDTTNSLNALGKIFDKKTVQEQQELAKLFGEVTFDVIGNLGLKEGSPEKVALDAFAGGLMAKLGGGNFASGAAGAGFNQLLMNELKNIKDPAAMQWASAIVGAIASKIIGGNTMTGASVAASETKNNWLNHNEQYAFELKLAQALDSKDVSLIHDVLAEYYALSNYKSQNGLSGDGDDERIEKELQPLLDCLISDDNKDWLNHGLNYTLDKIINTNPEMYALANSYRLRLDLGQESRMLLAEQDLSLAVAAGIGRVGFTKRFFNVQKQESPVWKSFDNVKGQDRKTTGFGNNKRYYEWDHTHNDIEVYDKKGRHLGSMDPITGEMYKPKVEGRTIDI